MVSPFRQLPPIQPPTKLIAARGLKPADVYQEAKRLLLPMRGIADVFTLAQLQGSDTSTPYLEAMRKSWHPDVAAPLQIVVKMTRCKIGGTCKYNPQSSVL